MYAGRIVEQAPVARAVRPAAPPLHGRPARGDAAAGPRPWPACATIPGTVPPPGIRRPGCMLPTPLRAQHPRCAAETPPLVRRCDGPRQRLLEPGAVSADRAAHCSRSEGLVTSFPLKGGGPMQRGERRRASSCSAARRWRWSASRAAASPRWPARCCGWSSPSAGRVRFAGQDVLALGRDGAAPAAARHAARLPGPDGIARPALHGRPHPAGAVRRARRRHARASGAHGSASCCAPSACDAGAAPAIRTSSPAASGSGSASPARSRSSPSWSSSTSRSRRWTSRSSRRS